jgi:hypothetical protein
MAFLTYLHAFAGQNFVTLMAAQAAIFAVFPLIVYLIGRELSGRALGTAAAVLTALRGLNSIAAQGWIDLASPKMMLTDFPTAIVLALLTLLVVRWFKDPAQKWHYALWAGCALGLMILLRTHALLLLPVTVLLALAVYRLTWRPWLIGAGLLALGMVLTTLPWDMRSYSRGAPLFSTYFYRIGLILRQRYLLPLGDASLPAPLAAQAPAARSAASLHAAVAVRIEKKDCSSLLCSGANHLLHNLETSVLFLPTSPVIDDLRDTVKESFPYWEKRWLGGGFNPWWGCALALNLALIALGIGAAWGRLRWPGLAPLFLYLGYTLSNTLALTSGGRYIVPVDWIVGVYFLLGALTLVDWGRSLLRGEEMDLAREPLGDVVPEPPRRGLWRGLGTVVMILAIGSLIPLSEMPFPLRYAESGNKQQRFTALREAGLFDGSSLKPGVLQRFLRDPDAVLVSGRALYPRYYWVGGGETAANYPYIAMDFPRLAFILIGPGGRRGVILPGDLPRRFPNGADVTVLGCRTSRNVDALVVFVRGDPGVVYTRSPASTLNCPLRQPVCTDKTTCY